MTRVTRKSFSRAGSLLVAIIFLWTGGFPQNATAAAPRIVNIYNFIRENDYRIPDSKAVLFEATRQQVTLLNQAGLPATFALQYDALLDTNYQKLLKQYLATHFEIGAWWEIPQKLAERAGLKWRGRHEWDPAANVGFSPGYTPEERRRLVDAYMGDFKAIFGHYPRTVGSWYIDEVTLAYMAKKYGIVASCNCKDQIGTDGYTLWGGYWNQAYYPSRLNAYMPAQTRAGQIDVPIFRMLGSDPIYQHGTTPGMFTLEPVYSAAGGSNHWVKWFMNNLTGEPCLAFAYTQAGQENSFGWDAMKTGLTRQVKLIAAEWRAGRIKVETLAQSGEWFRRRYSVTPPTAVVALDDWRDQGRKTVWYDSRFYRLNVLWQAGAFFIRDLHCFDERIVSPTHSAPLNETSLAYETLPIVDWAHWSRAGSQHAGMWPLLLNADGSTSTMTPGAIPVVTEVNATELGIRQPLKGGGTFSILCAEQSVTLEGVAGDGNPLKWVANIVGGSGLDAIVKEVNESSVVYSHSGVKYRLNLRSGAGACRRLKDGSVQLIPNRAGRIVLNFDESRVAGVDHRQDSRINK